MDAKVHLARPVHRNGEERIGLDRRDRRRQRADESVDRVADHHLGVAARRNFRGLFPALGRGFRPSALAGVAQAAPQARPKDSAKLPLVASADQEQVAPVVAVEKVVGLLAQAHPVAGHPKAAHLVGATAHQVEVRPAGAAWEKSLLS
jgi:hypothetical protein